MAPQSWGFSFFGMMGSRDIMQMIIIVIWTYLAFFIGKYAQHKGKKFGYYFLLSFLTTPLIGFIVLLITNE